MKCRRAKALIFDFIDGMIGDSDRIALEQHLSDCPSCDADTAGLTRSLELLHRAPQVQPDDNFNWKVRLAIARERDIAARGTSVQRVWLKAWNTRFATSAVAAFAVVVAAGFFAVRSFDTPADGPAAFAPAKKAESPIARMGEVGRNLNRPATGPTLGGVGFVSTNPTVSGTAHSGLIDEEGPTLDTDSLANRFRQSQMLQVRARQLEEQVRLLQDELRSCEGDGHRH